jgi:hypothetical protein
MASAGGGSSQEEPGAFSALVVVCYGTPVVAANWG